MKRTLSFVVVVGLLVLGSTTGAGAASAPARLRADVDCLPSGGAHLTFSVENLGARILRIDPDFHLILRAVRVGDDVGAAAFVLPAPGWNAIEPGGSRTWHVELGAEFDGSPGTDLSGLRLLLDAEVWLQGRPNPAVRTFSFPACDPPA